MVFFCPAVESRLVLGGPGVFAAGDDFGVASCQGCKATGKLLRIAVNDQVSSLFFGRGVGVCAGVLAVA